MWPREATRGVGCHRDRGVAPAQDENDADEGDAGVDGGVGGDVAAAAGHRTATERARREDQSL